MTPTLLPNLFPPSFNQMLRDRLQRSAEWRLCLDEHYLPGMNAQAHSDTGFVYYTYTMIVIGIRSLPKILLVAISTA
jgi:hypothetical protein